MLRNHSTLKQVLSVLTFSIASVTFAADDYPQPDFTRLLQQQMTRSKSAPMVKTALRRSKTDADLRTEEFGSATGRTVVQLTVQAGDQSVLLSAQASKADATVAATRITDPDGTVIYAANLETGTPVVTGSLVTNIIGNQSDMGMFLPLYPGGSGQLKKGTYQVEIATEDDVTIQNIKAIFKTGSITAQAIDFNFWVADRDASLIADTHLTPFFQSLQSEMNKILNPQNMRVGTLTFKVASEQDRNTFAVANGDDLSPLCAAVSRDMGIGRAMNVALVESITSGDATDVAGISPGLPGNLLEANARRNCVVMSQRAYGNLMIMHASNVLHEAGHYMSLPHTSEIDGLEHDYFADTSECDIATYDGRTNMDVTGVIDGLLSDHECGLEGGANNFLFFAGDPDFSPFVISDEQAFVLKRSPFFYPVESGIASAFNISPGITGSWYNPQQAGHGFMLEVLPGKRLISTWFVFDAEGNRDWIVAQGSYDGNSAILQAVRSNGGHFPPAFNATQVNQVPWGEIRFEFSNCQQATVSWTPGVAGFQAGSLSLERLTTIDSLSCQ